MLGTALAAKRGRRGHTMVEATIAMIVILIVFLALFNLADLIRAKLLVENAAVKCARARAVGYNDFMLRKIARLATMPVAGECLTVANSGDGKASYSDRVYRIGEYLMSDYEEQANAILDFAYWRNGGTSVSASDGTPSVSATTTQLRPRLFDFGVMAGGERMDENDRAKISATATVETHYTDYLQ